MFLLGKFPHVAIDTETDGLYYPRNKAIGFSIATPDGHSEYHDLRENPAAGRWLVEETHSYRGRIIGHNIKFDYKMFLSAGYRLPMDLLDDTATRACLINEHLHSYRLDDLSKKYLGEEKDSDMYRALADLFGGLATRNVQMKNISLAPVGVVRPYAKKDAGLALRLWEWQEEEIEQQGIQGIVDFERSLIPTILRAELRGIAANTDRAEEAIGKLDKIITPLKARLDSMAGWELNVNSGPQIKKLLKPREIDDEWFVGDTPVPSTKTGNPSIGAETLRNLPNPEAELILEVRSMIKTRDTFLKKHVIEHEVNGRVYPTINQNKGDDGGTGSGRLSYVDPAMQQIPSRNKEKAAIVKPMFEPDPGMLWVDADLSSFEVRVFYHLVNNPQLVAKYQSDPTLDAHQIVADMTGLVRNATYSGEPNAKQLNLSMIFNQGKGATAEKLGLPWDWSSFKDKKGEVVRYKKPGPEAERVIAMYHKRFPGVADLATRAKRLAEDRGYIYTKYGRRLRFPKGYKSYKASGLLIQATAADINKNNWKIIEESLGDQGHLILNTHDSYSMCIYPDNWEEVYARVKRNIIGEYPWFRIPLGLDLNGVGKTWWEAVQ